MNTGLPIYPFKDKILETIRENQVVIITAETGAGKSTQVPQYLLECGYKLIVTEPRRLATRSLAARVAFEDGSELGIKIGYRTAFERCDSPEVQCLFCTDGLELVRELYHPINHDILVIDELHEWNVNMETLLAWSKNRLNEDPNFRLVIMSATIDLERLSEYLGGAVILKIPGRTYPVENLSATNDTIVREAAYWLRRGRNILIFQPGKREIAETVESLNRMRLNAVILPLHSELEIKEQDKVFSHYGQPKAVIATNIAQTSITIDDIDMVIDAGTVRQAETINGIEGLYLRRISRADEEQRKGRAGRCKPGIYVNFYDGEEDQRAFQKAEIERVRLDQLVLRLAKMGIDASGLDFFHQPDKEIFKEARRCLYVLGAINERGEVTPIGEEMATYPLSVKFARMLIEAEKYNVVGDVITIVSCFEVGGILDRENDWRHLTDEEGSDLLAQMDVFNLALGMVNDNDRKENGVNLVHFSRAKEMRGKLVDELNKANPSLSFESCGKRGKILKACLAGMVDDLYFYRENRRGFCRHNEDAQVRQLSRDSVVKMDKHVDWVVGLPIDIEIETLSGSKRVHNLLTMVSLVKPDTLASMAPHLVKIDRRSFRLLSDKCTIVFKELIVFNGARLSKKEIKVPLAEIESFLPEGLTLEELKKQFAYGVVCVNNFDTNAQEQNWRREGKWWICPNGHHVKSPRKQRQTICKSCGATHNKF